MAGNPQAEFSPDALLAAWADSALPYERAAALVLATVVEYPQRDDVPLIIADALMCELGEVDGERTNVSLTDMTTLEQGKPDAALVAAHINASHAESDVRFYVPPRVATGFVVRCGYLSVEQIRRATLFHAQDEGIVVPDILDRPVVAARGSCPEEAFYTDGVPRLQQLLRAEDELRYVVSSSIMEAAEAVRFGPPPFAHGMQNF